MKLVDILEQSSIQIKIFAESKEDLIDRLIFLADKSGRVLDKDEAKAEVYEREKIMSTGVGKGIGLPHAKTNAVSATVGALAILSEPLDYQALDNKPVNIVFLLLGTEQNVGDHLRLLSRISRILNNDAFRQRLINTKSSEEAYEMILEADNQIG